MSAADLHNSDGYPVSAERSNVCADRLEHGCAAAKSQDLKSGSECIKQPGAWLTFRVDADVACGRARTRAGGEATLGCVDGGERALRVIDGP